MEKLQYMIRQFFSTLNAYDYIGFYLSLFLFLLFIILALLLRKHTKRSLLFTFFGFITLFTGPVFAHLLVKNTVFSSDASLSEVKQLHYSDTLIIRGKLNYKGSKDATHCLVEAKLYKQGSNAVKSFVYNLKAFRSGKQKIEKLLSYGDSVDFKIVIEPFNYAGDYNISTKSGCNI